MLQFEKSRMSFNQKLNLVQDLVIFRKNEYVKGIKILNEIKNKLSHELLANIDKNKIKELYQIFLKWFALENIKKKLRK